MADFYVIGGDKKNADGKDAPRKDADEPSAVIRADFPRHSAERDAAAQIDAMTDGLEAPPPAERAAILAEVERLRLEHRDLDAAIDALTGFGGDQIQVQRLKKRKLLLRDRISHLEDQVTPDIIA